nr:hypothetical protein [Tanacetum cinerariifolium]
GKGRVHKRGVGVNDQNDTINVKADVHGLSDVNKLNQPKTIVGMNHRSSSQQFMYAKVVNPDRVKNKVNFRVLESEVDNVEVDFIVPMASMQEVNDRFTNSLYGYFIGKRIAFPLVKQYAWNKWSKTYGIRVAKVLKRVLELS